MAEGAVRLPPDSTGTRLRTVTNAEVANGAHQEVITLASADGSLLSPATESTLAAILAELGQKLEQGQAVALDAATLEALENVNAMVSGSVAVSNFPATSAVTGPLTDAELRAAPVPISGTVDVTAADGVATEATLAALLVELGRKLEEGQAVALDGPTLAALETITAAISGVVAVSNFPATQSVSGPLTDEELRATPVPVSFPADEAGLTNAELRAAPVPVSGTVIANLGTIDGAATEDTLNALLTELGQKLEAGGAVALDAATLAALEAIQATVTGTVNVGNLPAVQPVSGTVSVSEPVTVDGTMALDASTLAALEQVEARSPLKALAMDYAGRSDAQPVYLGTAPPATADSVIGWTVTRFTYESAAADARVVRSDVRSPMAWANRTNPTLDGLPAWGA